MYNSNYYIQRPMILLLRIYITRNNNWQHNHGIVHFPQQLKCCLQKVFTHKSNNQISKQFKQSYYSIKRRKEYPFTKSTIDFHDWMPSSCVHFYFQSSPKSIPLQRIWKLEDTKAGKSQIIDLAKLIRIKEQEGHGKLSVIVQLLILI